MPHCGREAKGAQTGLELQDVVGALNRSISDEVDIDESAGVLQVRRQKDSDSAMDEE